VRKDYHFFFNNVKFLRAESADEGRGAGEGDGGEKFNTGFPLARE
jgi:hypothetical protein